MCIRDSAMGELQRGIENVEYACSAPEILKGEHSKNVGQSVDCWSEFQPLGVVAGITPFNFPAMVPMWMYPLAIVCGNCFILKPSERDPSSTLYIAELLHEAGLPKGVLNVVNGNKEAVDTLLHDERIQAVSFVGSTPIAEYIYSTATANGKRCQALGGAKNHAIVMPDADIEKVVAGTVSSGFSNAGQVCISAQRIITDRKVYADYIDALTEGVKGISTGNPMDENVKMGPMVRPQDAVRVNEWVREAVAGGARTVIGGEYEGAIHSPTVLADVKPEMRISCDELFGPAVAVTPSSSIEEAISLANDSNYGLSAAIFTQNIDWAMKFAREVESGNLMINSGPQWRADLMPYGGLKESGMGKEGPKYAVEEMTELKMVIYHP